MGFLQDSRYGFRHLLKAPAFTITAILTIARGVGANTAVFTLVHGVMLKSLPVTDPSQLVNMPDASPVVPRAGVYFSLHVCRL